MKNIIFISLFLFISCIKRETKISIDKTYCLNNQDEAVKMAEKVWLEHYGESIYNAKPFKARIKNDSIWIITGTLPEDYDGGAPYAEINAKNCKILSFKHEK